ncbi:MAG: PEP-CTERM sorting domain-containing protein [Phycisphaeraceae bacterium]
MIGQFCSPLTRTAILLAFATITGLAASPSQALVIVPAYYYAGASSGTTAWGGGGVGWETPNAEEPDRLDYSHSWAHSRYSVSWYDNNYTIGGYAETIAGSLPRIQLAHSMSGYGPTDQRDFSYQPVQTGATGRIIYYVLPVGIAPLPPDAEHVPVPFRYRAHGDSTVTHDGECTAYVTGSIRISWYASEAWQSELAFDWYNDNGSGSDPASFEVDRKLELPADMHIKVDMQLAGGVHMKLINDWSGTGQGSASVSGYLDPIIEIDPDWEYAQYYTLVYSDGIEQYVPEPTTMCLLGFGGLSLIRRRRA